MGLLLLVAALGGCASSRVYRQTLPPGEPIRPGDVRLFGYGDSIPWPHEEMAIIEAGGTTRTDLQEIVGRTINDAAEMGANGLVLLNLIESTVGDQIRAAALVGWWMPGRRSSQAQAIRIHYDGVPGYTAEEVRGIEAAEEGAAGRARPVVLPRWARFVGVRSRGVTYWVSQSCTAWHDAQATDLVFFDRAETGTLTGFRLSWREECRGPLEG